MYHSFSSRTCLLFAEKFIPDHNYLILFSFFFLYLDLYINNNNNNTNLQGKLKNEDNTPFWFLTKFKAIDGRYLSGSNVLEGITAADLTAYDASDGDIYQITDSFLWSENPAWIILSSNCQDNILVIDISNALFWVGKRKPSVCIGRFRRGC